MPRKTEKKDPKKLTVEDLDIYVGEMQRELSSVDREIANIDRVDNALRARRIELAKEIRDAIKERK